MKKLYNTPVIKTDELRSIYILTNSVRGTDLGNGGKGQSGDIARGRNIGFWDDEDDY